MLSVVLPHQKSVDGENFHFYRLSNDKQFPTRHVMVIPKMSNCQQKVTYPLDSGKELHNISNIPNNHSQVHEVFAKVHPHSQIEVILMKEGYEGHSGKDIKEYLLNRMKIVMHSNQYSHRTIK
jgi:hypothetical protein